MSKVDPTSIEKFQNALQKDPNSQVFAPLAEAYREMKMLPEAERTIRDGMKRHPNFVGGLVTLAKIMRDLNRFPEALAPLKKAAQLAPENILAHQLMAEIYLANRQPKESLKSFKMVLFLNPQSKTAQNAVQKLESLTADEYDDEVFEMSRVSKVKMDSAEELTPLMETRPQASAMPSSASSFSPAAPSPARALERMLSLIDAFIVRNDLEKAHLLLKDTLVEFGDNAEIQRRMKSLQIRTHQEPEAASPLRPMDASPLPSRQKMAQDKNLKKLNDILGSIDRYRAAVEI